MKNDYDVVIIGAGAAGVMAAITAAERGRSVCLIDHGDPPLRKVKISGGGRCNFTNLHANYETYVSNNPRFTISALSQFSPRDMIDMVEEARIPYYEKKLGQLFCTHSSQDLIDIFLKKCDDLGVVFQMKTAVKNVSHIDELFHVQTLSGLFISNSLVIATGGLSFEKMGATDFGHTIATQFNLPVISARPGLVPLTVKDGFSDLAGVAVPARVSMGKRSFEDDILFTHRGLSGPVILQISSYWTDGQAITLHLLPHQDVFQLLKKAQRQTPSRAVLSVIAEHLPKRLAAVIAKHCHCLGELANTSDKMLRAVADRVNGWVIVPNGTEGYKTAEVTVGGVNTVAIDSKTMESRTIKGLYFVGEVLDVTGWLGGYNLQWAWSSGYVAGLNC